MAIQCEDMRRYGEVSEVRSEVSEVARIDRSSYARIWRDMRRYGEMCDAMENYATIWRDMREGKM